MLRQTCRKCVLWVVIVGLALIGGAWGDSFRVHRPFGPNEHVLETRTSPSIASNLDEAVEFPERTLDPFGKDEERSWLMVELLNDVWEDLDNRVLYVDGRKCMNGTFTYRGGEFSAHGALVCRGVPIGTQKSVVRVSFTPVSAGLMGYAVYEDLTREIGREFVDLETSGSLAEIGGVSWLGRNGDGRIGAYSGVGVVRGGSLGSVERLWVNNSGGVEDAGVVEFGSGGLDSIAWIGDLDGDGVADEVLVGLATSMELYVVRGGEESAEKIEIPAILHSGRFGASVAYLSEEVDYATIVAVGAPEADEVGCVWICYLRQKRNTEIATYERVYPPTNMYRSQFGHSMAFAGDFGLEGGNVAGVLVGVPQYQGGRGGISVLSQTYSTVTVSYSTSVTPASEIVSSQDRLSGKKSLLGDAVAFLGDINGDGYPLEGAVSAPGVSDGLYIVFFGGNPASGTVFVDHVVQLGRAMGGLPLEWNVPGWNVRAMSHVGDLNGDTIVDLAVVDSSNTLKIITLRDIVAKLVDDDRTYLTATENNATGGVVPVGACFQPGLPLIDPRGSLTSRNQSLIFHVANAEVTQLHEMYVMGERCFNSRLVPEKDPFESPFRSAIECHGMPMYLSSSVHSRTQIVEAELEAGRYVSSFYSHATVQLVDKRTFDLGHVLWSSDDSTTNGFSAVSWIGDVNGDGVYTDMLVGFAADNLVQVWYGQEASPTATSPTEKLTIPAPDALGKDALFGASVALVGDVDLDGDPRELVVGAPGANASAGAVVMLWLHPNGTVRFVSEPIWGHTPDAAFGYAVSRIGVAVDSFNLDDTIAVGAPGENAVYLVRVGLTTNAQSIPSHLPRYRLQPDLVPDHARFGSSIANFKNAFGGSILVGAPGVQRVFRLDVDSFSMEGTSVSDQSPQELNRFVDATSTTNFGESVTFAQDPNGGFVKLDSVAAIAAGDQVIFVSSTSILSQIATPRKFPAGVVAFAADASGDGVTDYYFLSNQSTAISLVGSTGNNVSNVHVRLFRTMSLWQMGSNEVYVIGRNRGLSYVSPPFDPSAQVAPPLLPSLAANMISFSPSDRAFQFRIECPSRAYEAAFISLTLRPVDQVHCDVEGVRTTMEGSGGEYIGHRAVFLCTVKDTVIAPDATVSAMLSGSTLVSQTPRKFSSNQLFGNDVVFRTMPGSASLLPAIVHDETSGIVGMSLTRDLHDVLVLIGDEICRSSVPDLGDETVTTVPILERFSIPSGAKSITCMDNHRCVVGVELGAGEMALYAIELDDDGSTARSSFVNVSVATDVRMPSLGYSLAFGGLLQTVSKDGPMPPLIASDPSVGCVVSMQLLLNGTSLAWGSVGANAFSERAGEFLVDVDSILVTCPDGVGKSSRFGESVSTANVYQGGTLADILVGAPGDQGGEGAVYVVQSGTYFAGGLVRRVGSGSVGFPVGAVDQLGFGTAVLGIGAGVFGDASDSAVVASACGDVGGVGAASCSVYLFTLSSVDWVVNRLVRIDESSVTQNSLPVGWGRTLVAAGDWFGSGQQGMWVGNQDGAMSLVEVARFDDVRNVPRSYVRKVPLGMNASSALRLGFHPLGSPLAPLFPPLGASDARIVARFVGAVVDEEFDDVWVELENSALARVRSCMLLNSSESDHFFVSCEGLPNMPPGEQVKAKLWYWSSKISAYRILGGPALPVARMDVEESLEERPFDTTIGRQNVIEASSALASTQYLSAMIWIGDVNRDGEPLDILIGDPNNNRVGLMLSTPIPNDLSTATSTSLNGLGTFGGWFEHPIPDILFGASLAILSSASDGYAGSVWVAIGAPGSPGYVLVVQVGAGENGMIDVDFDGGLLVGTEYNDLANAGYGTALGSLPYLEDDPDVCLLAVGAPMLESIEYLFLSSADFTQVLTRVVVNDESYHFEDVIFVGQSKLGSSFASAWISGELTLVSSAPVGMRSLFIEPTIYFSEFSAKAEEWKLPSSIQLEQDVFWPVSISSVLIPIVNGRNIGSVYSFAGVTSDARIILVNIASDAAMILDESLDESSIDGPIGMMYLPSVWGDERGALVVANPTKGGELSLTPHMTVFPRRRMQDSDSEGLVWFGLPRSKNTTSRPRFVQSGSGSFSPMTSVLDVRGTDLNRRKLPLLIRTQKSFLSAFDKFEFYLGLDKWGECSDFEVEPQPLDPLLTVVTCLDIPRLVNGPGEVTPTIEIDYSSTVLEEFVRPFGEKLVRESLNSKWLTPIRSELSVGSFGFGGNVIEWAYGLGPEYFLLGALEGPSVDFYAFRLVSPLFTSMIKGSSKIMSITTGIAATSIAWIGDLDGDGYDREYVVGIPGNSRLYIGWISPSNKLEKDSKKSKKEIAIVGRTTAVNGCGVSVLSLGIQPFPESLGGSAALAVGCKAHRGVTFLRLDSSGTVLHTDFYQPAFGSFDNELGNSLALFKLRTRLAASPTIHIYVGDAKCDCTDIGGDYWELVDYPGCILPLSILVTNSGFTVSDLPVIGPYVDSRFRRELLPSDSEFGAVLGSLGDVAGTGWDEDLAVVATGHPDGPKLILLIGSQVIDAGVLDWYSSNARSSMLRPVDLNLDGNREWFWSGQGAHIVRWETEEVSLYGEFRGILNVRYAPSEIDDGDGSLFRKMNQYMNDVQVPIFPPQPQAINKFANHSIQVIVRDPETFEKPTDLHVVEFLVNDMDVCSDVGVAMDWQPGGLVVVECKSPKVVGVVGMNAHVELKLSTFPAAGTVFGSVARIDGGHSSVMKVGDKLSVSLTSLTGLGSPGVGGYQIGSDVAPCGNLLSGEDSGRGTDLLIGIPGAFQDAGAVAVVSLSSSLESISDTVVISPPGLSVNSYFGESVEYLGDFDGDGWAGEFAAGAPALGQVFVIYLGIGAKMIDYDMFDHVSSFGSRLAASGIPWLLFTTAPNQAPKGAVYSLQSVSENGELSPDELNWDGTAHDTTGLVIGVAIATIPFFPGESVVDGSSFLPPEEDKTVILVTADSKGGIVLTRLDKSLSVLDRSSIPDADKLGIPFDDGISMTWAGDWAGRNGNGVLISSRDQGAAAFVQFSDLGDAIDKVARVPLSTSHGAAVAWVGRAFSSGIDSSESGRWISAGNGTLEIWDAIRPIGLPWKRSAIQMLDRDQPACSSAQFFVPASCSRRSHVLSMQPLALDASPLHYFVVETDVRGTSALPGLNVTMGDAICARIEEVTDWPELLEAKVTMAPPEFRAVFGCRAWYLPRSRASNLIPNATVLGPLTASFFYEENEKIWSVDNSPNLLQNTKVDYRSGDVYLKAELPSNITRLPKPLLAGATGGPLEFATKVQITFLVEGFLAQDEAESIWINSETTSAQKASVSNVRIQSRSYGESALLEEARLSWVSTVTADVISCSRPGSTMSFYTRDPFTQVYTPPTVEVTSIIHKIHNVSIVSGAIGDGLLNPLGGTVLRIRGEGFGEYNISHILYDSSGELYNACYNFWFGSYDMRPPRTPPPFGYIVFQLFWAYVGSIPCDAVIWESSSSILCHAPKGVGTDLPVTVSIMVNPTMLHNAVDYASVADGIESVQVLDVGGNNRQLLQAGNQRLALGGSFIDWVKAMENIVSFESISIGPWQVQDIPKDWRELEGDRFILENATTPVGFGANWPVEFCVEGGRWVNIDSWTDAFLGGDWYMFGNFTVCSAIPSNVGSLGLQTSVLVSYEPPVISSVNPSVNLDSEGEVPMTIRAQKLGSVEQLQGAGLSPVVKIAGGVCRNLQRIGTSFLTCLSPAISSGSSALVVVDVGGATSVGVQVSVLRISVLGVSPIVVLPAAPGVKTYDIVVSVLGIESISGLYVGGIKCPTIEKRADSILCAKLPAPTRWLTDDVWAITLDGNETEHRALLRAQTPPTIFGISAPRYPTSGAVSLGVLGSGFGESRFDISAVVVGGNAVDAEAAARSFAEAGVNGSSRVASSSRPVAVDVFPGSFGRSRFSVRMPMGVGRNVPVRVFTRFELLSDPVFFSFDLPVVEEVIPDVLLSGSTGVEVNLCGRNFGPSGGFLERVSIGGIDCLEVEVVLGVGEVSNSSAECVRCIGFDTPKSVAGASPDAWVIEDGVEVVVAGQSSGLVRGLVDLIPPPLVTSVLPTTAGPGDLLRVGGEGFGSRRSDVARVEVGSEPCVDVIWVSSTQLTCVVGVSHFLWSRDGATTDYIVPRVYVNVVLRNGLESGGESLESSFEPSGLRLRPPPTTVPRGVAGWRRLGRSGSFVLQWRFPWTGLETLMRGDSGEGAVESFELQVLDGDTVLESRVVARAASLQGDVIDGSLDALDAASWELHSSALPVVSRFPLRARLRGVNSDGATMWVEVPSNGTMLEDLGSQIAENCVETEYLATQNGFRSIYCEPCPEGAACAGLPSKNVTAKSGYWRVPWVPDAIGFAECPIEGSCLGAKASDATPKQIDSDFGGGAENASLEMVWSRENLAAFPIAVPGARLVPNELEGCRTGHRGVLCASCEEGYFAGVGNACEPCGNSALIVGRAFGLFVGAMVLLAALLTRAWRMRASQSSREMQVIKVILSHLQTVSIVGAVQLRWPAATSAFLQSVNVVSSFSTSGLALECLLGAESQSPFARTLLILSMPFWLLLFAAAFWSLVAAVEPYSASLRRLLAGPVEDRLSAAASVRRRPKKRRSVFVDVNEGQDWRMLESRYAALRRVEAVSSAKVNRDTLQSNPLANRRESMALHAAITNKSSGPAVSTSSVLAIPEDQDENQSLSLFARRMLVSSIVIGFLVHTPLTTAAFRLLTCRLVSPADNTEASQLRLAMDMDVRCDDPAALATMLGIGVPTILIVSLGIPIGAAMMLAKIGPVRLSQPLWRERLFFLYGGFRVKMFFWESVVLLRKVCIAAVTTSLAPSGAGLQVSVGLVVMLFAQVLHGRAQPYSSKAVNALEGFALVTAAVTLVGGIFVVIEAAGAVQDFAQNSTSLAASILIIFVNVVFLLSAMAILSSRARDMIDNAYEAIDLRIQACFDARHAKRTPSNSKLHIFGTPSSAASIANSPTTGPESVDFDMQNPLHKKSNHK